MNRTIQPELFDFYDSFYKGEEDPRWLFCITAYNTIGKVKEEGNNRGKLPDLFLSTVGLHPGNPYCLAFVHSVAAYVEKKLGYVCVGLYPTAHVDTCFEKCPKKNLVPDTRFLPGDVLCWRQWKQLPGSNLRSIVGGHASLVMSHWLMIGCVEANTHNGKGTLDRERDGDGVWYRTRNPKGYQNFELRGAIRPTWVKV